MDTPTVSVIMAAYNTGSYIGQAIRSVQSQTVCDWELLVVDDASTDDTLPLARQAARDDARIRVWTRPANSGPAAARNLALEEARGTYVAILDSDDLAYPHRFATCLGLLAADPSVRFVHGNLDLTDQQGRFIRTMWPPVGHGRALDRVFRAGLIMPGHSVWFAERALLLGAGGV